jgi:predicted acyltransferase
MAQLNPGERLVSLDAFRGATIALMVLVNDAGDGNYAYAPLRHAEWHGWTLTDAVFPSFLWIVGVALTLALAKRSASGASRSQLILQALKRAAILFALGLFIYAYPHFDLGTQRILGVLQRIAICYFIATVIYLYTSWRGQVLCVAGLLISYWLIMAFAPVPNIGSGFFDEERNFAHYIDQIVLGSHNYHNTKTWDPEGIVSTLPAIGTALLGVLAGQILKLKKTLAERTVWLFLTGNILLTSGLILDQWLPINKKLWTSSFALLMAGLDFIAFAICLWLIDEIGWKRITYPFVILGRNAIAIYMVAELLSETLSALHWHKPIYQAVFAPYASPINASLAWAVTYTLLMFAVAWYMNRRGWFLRV